MRRSQIAARLGLAIVAGLGALLIASTGYGFGGITAQVLPTPTPTPTCLPGYDWTPWGGCQPISNPCPAGTIDIQGNGRDDGGNDCQALDLLTQPTSCTTWPGGPYLAADGNVTCRLPLSISGQPLTVMGAAGCMDVTRKPYPRAMVNTRTTFTVNGLFSTVQNIEYGQPGWYRLRPDLGPWAAEGLYLHERYGNVTLDSLGRPAFNTSVLLAGDSYPYPSLNNVRANVQFLVSQASDAFRWSVTGLLGEVVSLAASSPVDQTFAFASYPAARPYPISITGPSLTGQNNLPAYQVRLRATWQAWLVVEWDNYLVDGGNAYVRGSHAAFSIPLGTYYSYRVWDRQQSIDGVQSIYCNAAADGGYLPVPVLEAQAVLKQ